MPRKRLGWAPSGNLRTAVARSDRTLDALYELCLAWEGGHRRVALSPRPPRVPRPGWRLRSPSRAPSPADSTRACARVLVTLVVLISLPSLALGVVGFGK